MGAANGGIRLTLNGGFANEGTNRPLRKGRIALSSERTPVEFKDIAIREKK